MDTEIIEILRSVADQHGTQAQAIAQLNHDYTSLAISLASISKDVEWLKWFFLAITVAVVAQTVKMIVDHFSKGK